MAMKRKPKPLRPDPSGVKAEVRGRLSTRPVRQLGITGPLKKETIRNPKAPTGGSGASTGSVRVLSKTESMLKREKAMRERNQSRSTNATPFKKSDAKSKAYGTQSIRARESQKVAGTNYQSGMSLREYQNQKKLMKTVNAKADKPTKTTPKKKTPPAPKPPKPPRRILGSGMVGGSLFGGGLRKNK